MTFPPNNEITIYCTYAEDWHDGGICPHTARKSCIYPDLCPMIETGYATIGEEEP